MSNSSFQLPALTLGTTGIVAGTYGNGSSFAQLTVNSAGLITAISNQSITGINNGVQISGLRNVIINGGMQISQRNTVGSVGGLTASTLYTSIDRWGIYQGGSPTQGTMGQSSSAPAGFQYSLRAGRPSGGTNTNYFTLAQVIETANTIPLSGTAVTLSYYAKCGTTFSAPSSSFQTVIATGTGTDEGAVSGLSSTWTGYSSLLNSGTTLTTSWQKFSYTVNIPSTATEAIVQFYWNASGTAGADDNIYITGVQLEIGSAATQFENRPFEQELELCQRYYNKSFNYNTAPANAIGTNTGETMWDYTNGSNNSVTRAYLTWNVPMRTTPTVTFYNPASNNSQARQYNLPADCSSTGTAQVSDKGMTIITTTPSPTSLGNQLGVHWAASAEL